MLHAVTTKLEIDIVQASELPEAMELAAKHKFPAMVVHPDLVGQAILQRQCRQAACKIIVPVDWPKGDRYGITKLHNLPLNAVGQNGFEILLSPATKAGEVKAEAKALLDFVRDFLPPGVEVRFVLDVFSRQDKLDIFCDGLKGLPAPAFLRTDRNLRVQQSKSNQAAQEQIVSKLRTTTGYAVKLSGSVTYKIATSGLAARYAVSLQQALAIIKEASEADVAFRDGARPTVS